MLRGGCYQLGTYPVAGWRVHGVETALKIRVILPELRLFSSCVTTSHFSTNMKRAGFQRLCSFQPGMKRI
jgi:hypothetical protein